MENQTSIIVIKEIKSVIEMPTKEPQAQMYSTKYLRKKEYQS